LLKRCRSWADEVKNFIAPMAQNMVEKNTKPSSKKQEIYIVKFSAAASAKHAFAAIFRR